MAMVSNLSGLIEEPPEYATAPRIETRFSAQLSILTELAASYPLDSCVEEEPMTNLVRTLDRLNPWLERIDEVRGRFVRYEDRPADAGGAIIRLSVDLVALDEVEDS